MVETVIDRRHLQQEVLIFRVLRARKINTLQKWFKNLSLRAERDRSFKF
jgi:hypothetical protein